MTALTVDTAAALAAAACAVFGARGPGARLPRHRRRRPLRVPSDPRAALAGGALVAGLSTCLDGPAVGAGFGVLSWAVLREVVDHQRLLAVRRERAAWSAALRGIAAALAAGLPLPESLGRGADAAAAVAPVAAPSAVLASAVATARVGGDLVEDLARRAPDGPGRRLVAALGLARSAGLAPAVLLDELALAAAAEERAELQVVGLLAGARATMRLLAALPLVGVALAAAFGASAPAFLLGPPVGRGCLLAAAVLEAVGLRWSARIVRAGAA